MNVGEEEKLQPLAEGAAPLSLHSSLGGYVILLRPCTQLPASFLLCKQQWRWRQLVYSLQVYLFLGQRSSWVGWQAGPQFSKDLVGWLGACRHSWTNQSRPGVWMGGASRATLSGEGEPGLCRLLVIFKEASWMPRTHWQGGFPFIPVREKVF